MANNNAFIQFKWGTLENFNSLQDKDINTVYFLDDGSLYLGNQFIGKDYEYGDYSTSWPLNPIIGKLYIDVSTGEIRDYDGTDWTTIIDPSIFGEKSYYDNKSKKAEYLYEMDYSILDYEAAKTHFLEQRNSSLLTGAGACSSVVSNGFAGRNFDWFYNSDVTVVIHTPQVTHIEDNVQTITRHAVLGVAGGHAEITKETIESGENSELYKYIPFYLLDGINDTGLYCNINVVPLENGYTSYSNPTGSEEEELCVLMLSRYVLDKFSSASTAASYIQQHVKVYGTGYLDNAHYGIHMMISDGASTKVLEFINGVTVITDSSIMTNFMIDGVTFEADGSVLTNPVVSGDSTPSSKGLSLHGSGLERWNILNANKSLVNSIDSMGELMASIKYSQTYTNGDNNDRPIWYSELCNDSSHGGNEVNVDTVITSTVITNAISTVRGWYQSRERGDMKTWHTAHSSAYDFATKSLRLISQEDFDTPYYFYLADTLNELDIKISKIKQECEQTSAVLYTEQTLTDAQKQQARTNIGVEPSVEIIPVDFFSDDISGKLCYPSPTEEQMEVLYRALHSSDDRNVIVAVSNHYSKSDLWLANIFTYPDMSGIEYVSFSRGSRIVESDFFTGGSRLIHRTVATNVRVFFPKNSIAAFNAKTYEEQVEQLGVDLVSGYIVTLGSDMHNLSKANMSMIYSDPQSFLDFDSDPYSEEILSVKIKRDGDNGISIYGYRFFEDNGIQKLMICSVEFDSSIGKLVASEKVYTVGGITDAPSDNKQYARKNGEWEEVDSQPLMVETTYSALKLLRDTRNLVPGMQYRITDYVTTTAASNTRSAGHAFDIIVTADDVNMLNENARAIQHKGDTYFTNSNLNAWELKYCLNNDTTRFDWADTINGKGVIYYMKDEFNNECPYDFKNIQFMVGAKSNAGTLDDVYYYTFSVANDMGDMTITDHSLNGAYCYGNSFKEYINLNKITLNIIVFRNTSNTNGCYSNTFGNNCFDNTFGEGCCNNIFRNECNNNTFGNDYIGNTFENYCTNNTFGDGCLYNTFGNNCRFNTFASDSTGTAGNYFYCNTLENGVQYCTIYNTSTASSSQQVKNYHIKSSVIGTSSSRKLIETTRNLAYDTTVALNSSGELKIYCEADLIA